MAFLTSVKECEDILATECPRLSNTSMLRQALPRAVFTRSSSLRTCMVKGQTISSTTQLMSKRFFGTSPWLASDQPWNTDITMTFTVRDENGGLAFSTEVNAVPGDILMEAAVESGEIDIEAACGGKGKCSTCHVVLPPEIYDMLDPPNFFEEDTLDKIDDEGLLAPTSRLSCQCEVTDIFDGAEIIVPGIRPDVRFAR